MDFAQGGMLPDLMEMATGGEQFLTVGGEYHRIYKNAQPDIMVNHPKEDKGKWDTINLTDKAGAKTVADGVAATKKWHRENPYAFGGNIILEKYQEGGSTWEILPEAQEGKITLDEFRPKFANSNEVIQQQMLQQKPLEKTLPEVEITATPTLKTKLARAAKSNVYASGRAEYIPIESALLPGSLPIQGSSALGKAGVFAAEALNPVSGFRSLKGAAKQIPGSGKKFTSEIDWGKWNPETPNYPELINEYNAIEESTKKAGNWMKYSDGTPFNGTPEQFIQMKSSHAEKYAGGKDAAEKMYKNRLYRGAHFHVDDFANRTRNDFATFFTDNLENAKTYTDKGADFFNPSINPIGEYKVEEGLYEIGIPSNVSKVIGSGEGRNWRLLNWDDKIAKGTTSKGYAERFQEELKDNAIQEYGLSDYDPSKKYLSTDIYANYVKNPNNPETVAQINDVVDTMGDRFLKPNTVYAVDAQRTPIKSLRHNVGFFDMTNPNIYKALVPPAAIIGASQIEQRKSGGKISNWEIVDDNEWEII